MKNLVVCLLVVLALGGCRTSALKFQCSGDEKCSGGRCIDGFCAFADATCASGYRYQRADKLTNMCAPAAAAGPDLGMSEPVDLSMAPAIDMAVPLGPLTWKAEDSSASWHGVWGSSPSNVYAVGAAGKIGHRSPNGLWEYSQSITTESTLLGIWGSSANEIYLWGDNLATMGTSISVAYGTGNGQWMNSALGPIWFLGVDANHQYAFSQTSSGQTWTGSHGVWTQPGKGPPGIEGISSGWGDGVNFYVGSADGFFANATATNFQWQPQTTGITGTIRVIWGATPTDIYACGDGGQIAYTKGDGTWKMQTQQSGSAICRYMWSSSAGDVYAVGDAATVLHSNGDGNWKPITIPGVSTQNVYGIWGSGPNDVYLAADGLILHGTR